MMWEQCIRTPRATPGKQRRTRMRATWAPKGSWRQQRNHVSTLERIPINIHWLHRWETETQKERIKGARGPLIGSCLGPEISGAPYSPGSVLCGPLLHAPLPQVTRGFSAHTGPRAGHAPGLLHSATQRRCVPGPTMCKPPLHANTPRAEENPRWCGGHLDVPVRSHVIR